MANLSLTVVPSLVLSDKTHKIRVAIAHKSKTRYITTRFIINNLKQFKDGRVIGRDDAPLINMKLRGILDECQEALDKINIDAFSCAQLKDYLEHHKSSGMPVSARWQEYINELIEEDRKGTAGLHDRTKVYFEAKFSDYVTFDSITPNLIKDFEKYLYRIKKLGDTTVSMYMKRLKVIINAAKKDNIVKYEIEPFAY